MRKLPTTLVLAIAGASLAAWGDEPAGVLAKGSAARPRKIADGLGTARELLPSLTTLTLEPGAVVRPGDSGRKAAVLYVEEGLLEVSLGGRVLNAGKGDAVYVPAGAERLIRNASPVSDTRVVELFPSP